MKPRTLYFITLALLCLVTVAGIMFPGEKINDHQGFPNLQGASIELTHIWINYYTNTGLYEYGAEIKITNNRQSAIMLSSLQVVFSGEGRNQHWNGSCAAIEVTIAPGESEVVKVHSPDVQASHLGFVGAVEPREYLQLASLKTNLGVRVSLQGIDSSSQEVTQFESEADSGLPMGNASQTEFASAHELTQLGFESEFLDRWMETFNYLPGQDHFKFQPVQQGILGTARFPLLTVYGNFLSSYHSVSLSTVEARTITVSPTEGQKVYYLFGRDYKFDDYLKEGALGEDGDTVYFYGDVFSYLAQTGTHYSVMFPTEVSRSEIRDPVEAAKGVITSRVGEDYFQRYFSDPIAVYDENAGNYAHFVSFTYHISVGDYTASQPIYLYFDSEWRLTSGSEYIPVEGNFQPFKVTEDQAKAIAIEMGISAEPYGLNAYIGNSGIWPNKSTDFQGKYVWWVSTWIDPPDSNPRRNISAVIDPNTGEFYGLEEGGVGYIVSRVG